MLGLVHQVGSEKPTQTELEITRPRLCQPWRQQRAVARLMGKHQTWSQGSYKRGPHRRPLPRSIGLGTPLYFALTAGEGTCSLTTRPSSLRRSSGRRGRSLQREQPMGGQGRTALSPHPELCFLLACSSQSLAECSWLFFAHLEAKENLKKITPKQER